MSLAVRRAAATAAVLGLATAATGAEARPRSDNMLVAQIAQVTPAATPSAQPSLTTHPPTPLGRSRAPGAAASVTSLPRTGAEPALVALAGVSLLGAGVALKVSLRADA